MSDWIDLIVRVEIGSEKWYCYYSIVVYYYYFFLWKIEEQIVYDVFKIFLDYYFLCIYVVIK